MRVLLICVLLVLGVGGGLWLYFKDGLPSPISAVVESPDQRDWQAAKKSNSDEGYIGYLASHKNGAFESQARAAARGFLAIKFTEVNGLPLVTDGWGKGDLDPIPSEPPPNIHYSHPGYYVEGKKQEATTLSFDGSFDLRLRGTNVVLHPRIPCGSTITIYRDKSKGVLLFGFDIYLQGKSQSVPIYQADFPAPPSGPIGGPGCKPGTVRVE